jgi:hypothetical protein
VGPGCTHTAQGDPLMSLVPPRKSVDTVYVPDTVGLKAKQ